MWNLTTEKVLTNRHEEIHHGPAPPIFKHHLLSSISSIQIAWWDECRIEQQGAKLATRCISTVFDATRIGNYTKTANTKNLPTKTALKYPEQGRLSFGVAKSQLFPSESHLSPVPIGVRLPHIDYILQNIVTIEMYDKHIKMEIARVKSLTGDRKSTWPITLILGAGSKKRQDFHCCRNKNSL